MLWTATNIGGIRIASYAGGNQQFVRCKQTRRRLSPLSRSITKASASFECHQNENGILRDPVFGTLSVPVRKGEQWTLELDIKRSHYCTLFIQAHWVPFGPGCTAGAPL